MKLLGTRFGWFRPSRPTVLVVALWCLSVAQAQTKREVTADLDSQNYLFFLDEKYWASATVPVNDRVEATGSQTQVQTLTVGLKAAPTGVLDIPEMKVECQGVIYVMRAHKIAVLGQRPKEAGFCIHTLPDPNGSGNVELLIGWNTDKRPEHDIQLDYAVKREGIDVRNKGTSTSFSDDSYQWTMKLMLRNTTGTPYTLERELFENLPTLEEWPEIVIPPTKTKR